MNIGYISDDIRLSTGYGKIGKAVCTHLTKQGHKVITLGGSLNSEPFQPIKHEGITIFPVNGYGGNAHIDYLLNVKLDVLLINADPRFFEHVWEMDAEIRKNCPLIFLHLWDDEPFPIFNVPKYKCCDHIIAASKFTYNLLTEGFKDIEGMPPLTYIPIGTNLDVYRPLLSDKKEEVRKYFLGLINNAFNPKFIVGFIGRFAVRKRVIDIMDAFTEFAKDKKDVMLLLHTTLQDEAGVIGYVKEQLFKNSPIVISQMMHQPEDTLNELLNMFCVNINLSSAEGFGMPIIQNITPRKTPEISSHIGLLQRSTAPGVALRRDDSRGGAIYCRTAALLTQACTAWNVDNPTL